MAEVKCRLCGGETNEKDGICRICQLFRKEEVAKLSVIPAESGILQKDAGQASMTRKTNGGKMGHDFKSHRKCKTEGCFKYAVREGMCTRCYNKAHGIEKHIGRKPGEKANTAPLKICIDCKEEYKPTSNVQKRCLDCKKKHMVRNKSQVSQGAPPIKKAKAFGANIGPQGGRVSEPEIKKEIKIETEVKKDNAVTAALAQLLLTSNLLDGQLNSLIENGTIDTKIMLDIRFRIGAVLRNGLPPAEVRA